MMIPAHIRFPAKYILSDATRYSGGESTVSIFLSVAASAGRSV
jgi:hypothetical protein